MDGISSIGSVVYAPSAVPLNTVSTAPATPLADSVTLSGDDPSSGGEANVYAPDAGFSPQGSAALAYLTPQAAAQSGSVNLSA